MIDLTTYSERIGLPLTSSPDANFLAKLQRAHRLAIPFENLDIPLGRGIDLDPGRIFDKIVRHRRGGYCFEQNRLFLDVLRALGFEARPLLARVWMDAGNPPPVWEAMPATHMLNLVHVDGNDWICDVGFGGGYAPPMRLVPGQSVTSPDCVSHRLIQDADHGFLLQRDGGGGWINQYSFHLHEVAEVDLEVANHWTSTRPGTRFTTRCVASLATPAGFKSMVDLDFTVTEAGRSDSRTIADPDDYQETLQAEFGIGLGLPELAGLNLFEPERRAQPA